MIRGESNFLALVLLVLLFQSGCLIKKSVALNQANWKAFGLTSLILKGLFLLWGRVLPFLAHDLALKNQTNKWPPTY